METAKSNARASSERLLERLRRRFKALPSALPSSIHRPLAVPCCPEDTISGGVFLPGAGAMRLSLVRAMAETFTPWPGYRYGMNRPGSFADRVKNPPGTRRRKIFVEPIPEEEWKFFKGDVVQVLKGKDTGKQGRVAQVIKERNWVVVQGLNVHYRYVGRSATSWGVCTPSEAPLLVKDVSLVEPTDKLPTQVEWRYTEEGERVRVSVRTGRILPKPVEEREDGIIPEQWIDGPKDTSVEDALQKTYVPSLKTFQEEIMELKGIVETRRFRKSYWY